MLQLLLWTGSQWQRELKNYLLLVALMVVLDLCQKPVELRKAFPKHINLPLFQLNGVMKVLHLPQLVKMDLSRFGQEVVCSDHNLFNAINQSTQFAGVLKTIHFSTALKRTLPLFQLFQETNRTRGKPMTVLCLDVTGTQQTT